MIEKRNKMIEREFQKYLSKCPELLKQVGEEVVRRVFYAGCDAHNICSIKVINQLEKQYGSQN